MPEREPPDLDHVRDAMREHDRHGADEPETPPEKDEGSGDEEDES